MLRFQVGRCVAAANGVRSLSGADVKYSIHPLAVKMCSMPQPPTGLARGWNVPLLILKAKMKRFFYAELTNLKAFGRIASMKNNMNNNKKFILDNAAWAELYEKFSNRLINGLNRNYCFADREDAVEFAFDKLMHRKDAGAYGDKYPRTEKDWLCHLYWQARSFLSHIKSRSDRHAKYVELMSKELEGAFISGVQGIDLDSKIRSEALVKALEIFRSEQDITRRDLTVFVLRSRLQIPSKKIAARYNLTVGNVDVIKHRIGKLLRKYGPDCYIRALRRAA